MKMHRLAQRYINLKSETLNKACDGIITGVCKSNRKGLAGLLKRLRHPKDNSGPTYGLAISSRKDKTLKQNPTRGFKPAVAQLVVGLSWSEPEFFEL